jgi:cytochrome c peroxidase
VYEKTEAEVIGVPQKNDTINAKVDPDEGKFALHKIEKHRFAFKTPTVRNVELTAPYMHNGVFSTLEEVVEFYNRGGGKGIGINLPNQTLPEDKLNLTKEEKQQIISFLNALTDTTNVTSRPLVLPVLSDKSKNRRLVGGKY